MADGATFIRNRDIPEIRDANRLIRITASTPKEIDRLLARVEQEFAGFPHRCFDLGVAALPALEAHLTFESYRRSEMLIMHLENDLAGMPKPYDIKLVEDEVGWDAYTALHDLDWQEVRERKGEPYDEQTAKAMVHAHRIKAPPVRYWLAFIDGHPRAYCSSWVSTDGVGQVEDLFTHPDFRHRGLATALIHRCVADCRERGAGPIFLGADPSDTPKQMYAALGFHPIAFGRDYWKNINPTGQG